MPRRAEGPPKSVPPGRPGPKALPQSPAPLPVIVKRQRGRRVILDVSPAVETGPASNALFVERFLTYVRHERALADNTLQAYARDLRDFSAWLGGRNAAAISIRDLGDYLGHLSKKGLARASVARQAATLRVFFAFLQLEGTVQESPAALLAASRRDDTMPGAMSPEQVDRLLASPDGGPKFAA